jgi:plasmid stability protein
VLDPTKHGADVVPKVAGGDVGHQVIVAFMLRGGRTGLGSDRVPEDIHRRLAARAARAGKSVNAVANEILDAAVDADEGDRRTRLHARAAALGVLQSASGAAVDAPRRRRIVASTIGTGPVIDRLLAEERERE